MDVSKIAIGGSGQDMELGREGRIVPLPRGALSIADPRELLASRSLPAAFEPGGSVAGDTLRRANESGRPLDVVPDKLDGIDVVEVCEEDVIWGGPVAPADRPILTAFGNFPIESLSRLWPLLPGGLLEGLPVVLTKPRCPPYVDEWLRAFGARIVELPEHGVVRFTKMHVPESAWRLAAWIAPELRDIYLHARLGLDVPTASRRDVLWLSRSTLEADRVPQGEAQLEALLRDYLTIVEPQTMTLAEQVAALEGSRAVAGVIGSAFHALLMTLETPDCLYLCPPWDKGVFAAQHQFLDGRATFAQALESMAGTSHMRDEGIAFPRGYRLLTPEALGALSNTVLPELRHDPDLATAAGQPSALRELNECAGSRNIELPRGSLALSAPRELDAVRSLPPAFEPDGAVARDTLHTIAELPLNSNWKRRPQDTDLVRVDAEDVVWGGQISSSYGHFLVESISRLWPLLPGGQLEGLPVVFTTPRELPYVDEWLRAFGARIVELPEHGVVRFTKMHVPESAWRLEAWIAPEVRDIHLHARHGMDVPPAPEHNVLWLSRTGLWRSGTVGLCRSAQSGRYARIAYDECLLEWLLGEHITPIAAETMTLAEQVATLEGSRAVAGVIGSAFHTLLMTMETPDCLYLCPPWDKGSFPAQHRLLGGKAAFAHGLEVAAWSPRARREGIDFPHGYRFLIPEVLRAMSASVLPTLLEDSRLAAFADPVHHLASSATAGTSGRDLDEAVARVLLEPLSIEARMHLGDLFETEGLEHCALEQFMAVAELNEAHREAASRSANLLGRIGRADEGIEMARRANGISPGPQAAPAL